MNRMMIISEINKALNEIRPYLNNDGGDISFIGLSDDNIVKVKLHGACHSCKVNQMTLKSGVELTIKKYVPEIKEVVQVEQ